ncbi:hypothetical protein E6C60_0671 [Paenibacillus algicola]|uniref:Restriction endonuclease type IV Mrr domain-containing protein n=1 Tax=Paenibacillus algicola TaxID=2565926 RepID=A0A4P8XGW6_9BACL|nr:restriction endonuclease [Paenibacillus algicola]QCT01393.1 hypothetical protein E6C60_0671 [Paenibacillus algicola]
MTYEELIQYISNQSEDDEVIHIETDDSKKLSISDLPENANIQIGDTIEGILHIKLEGTLAWNTAGEICIAMAHNWYRKFWYSPLGIAYYMDLMKRLVEFREQEYGDIESIQFEDDGDWCHLYYSIKIPRELNNLYDIYCHGLSIYEWIESIVIETELEVSQLFTKATEKYSKYKLIEIPELIQRVETEDDANEKGRLLEELICKIFAEIPGFEVRDRIKSETEEIDIVILNRSDQSFWQKESSLILVECKNWSSKCGKNELVVFKEKILNRRGRAKIGFLVSWNGFAGTFLKEDLRTSQNDVLIIPVTGDDIKRAVSDNNIQETLVELWLDAVVL